MSEKPAVYETINEKLKREADEKFNNEIEEIKTRALSLENEVELMSIDSPEEMNSAGGFVMQLKEGLAKMETMRLFLVKPLKIHIKTIEDEIKKTTVPVECAVRRLTDKILEFKREEQRKQDEITRIEEQKKQELLQKCIKEQGGGAAPNKIIQVPKEVMEPIAKQPILNQSVGGLAVKKYWTFDVVDAVLIPREYLKVDEVAINKAVGSGVREITGVEIYQEERLSR